MVSLRGFARIPGALIENTSALVVGGVDTARSNSRGAPMFMATASLGKWMFEPASWSTDQVARVVGHCVDKLGTDYLVYFNPDQTWIEVS